MDLTHENLRCGGSARKLSLALLGMLGLLLSACTSGPRVGDVLARRGDEIVVAGQFFHTGAPVVLWTDPGGYDAYRIDRRFARPDRAAWDAEGSTLKSPYRFGTRFEKDLDADTLARVRAGGWTLEELQERVDQFVLHYDVCGTSRTCFRVLHDMRGLSVHFLIDIDGTIYQTLDVQERAWHATISNDRSVGVEIAHIGAYGIEEEDPLDRWYAIDERGPRITIPPDQGDGGVRDRRASFRPARRELITGEVQGRVLRQYDFTPEQYESLARLSAALSVALPAIRLDAPRDDSGRVVTRELSPQDWSRFGGILGHFHIQANKVDPGPAMDWEGLLRRARALRGSPIP